MSNSKRPIIGFIHIYTVNNWREIFGNQIYKLKNSGLLSKVEKIYVGIIGSKVDINLDKVEVLFNIDNPEIGESLTLALMHQKSMTFDGAMFYIHSKGVSRNSPQQHTDWRNYMEYFIINRHEDCLRELEKADCVGVNWYPGGGKSKSWMYGKLVFQPTMSCFEGNFWWTNSEYVRNLPRLFPIKGRFDSEFWIGLNNPRVAELWHSGVRHHRDQYPQNNYMDKINVRYFKGP